MKTNLYTILRPPKNVPRVPILISVPHAGTKFPAPMKKLYQKNIINFPEDADWFVHELYSFAPKLGITVIAANYSRYVIDLNRSPENKRLYSDSRKETALLPTHTFAGYPIYKSDYKISSTIIASRKNQYYWPYYKKIATELRLLQKKFPQVLFFDAHSIRPFVPSIRKERFPDLILGNAFGKTASPQIIENVWKNLKNTKYKVSHNEPFQGGQLTRYFGNPAKNVHALQLEMSQSVYLADNLLQGKTKKFPSHLPSSQKVRAIQAVLQKIFLDLTPLLQYP